MTENEPGWMARTLGGLLERFDRPAGLPRERSRWWLVAIVLLPLLLITLGFGWYWSRQPSPIWVNEQPPGGARVVGYATTDALASVARTLLEKPGGYLSNDISPPSVFLDNMPNWEFGVLVQVRDLARAMRNDYSRSQSQSIEDPYLALVEPGFNFNSERWMLPSTERKYRQAIESLEQFQSALIDAAETEAQFYARADNLRTWLEIVEKRLGSLSQRLSASVGSRRVNIDLAGDPAAAQSTPVAPDVSVKTPWLQIDDVFYESRGTAWALVHFLRAAELDFEEILEKKNAVVSLRQIIRELEASIQPLRSPIVLNGGGYGIFANHSLVMASYLSRANAAVINLRELLAQG